jgi:RimJ/RimL family protein N-acetyltransferase
MSAIEIGARSAHDTARTITQRPIRPDDAERLARLFERLSPTSRYRRFFSPVAKLPRNTLHRLAIVDHDRREAIVAVHGDEIVGVASYEGDADDATAAEVAVLVDDEWQRAGIATFLLDRLAREARAHGVETFTATVLADNVPAVALTRTLNRFARMQGTGPERTLVMPLRRPTTTELGAEIVA